MSRKVWIWFAENGNIRKWSTDPFPEGTRFIESDAGHLPGWRERGDVDPHAPHYDHAERIHLCGGHLTDDEVAFDTAMLMRDQLNFEGVLATAKDRIRWLSRRNAALAQIVNEVAAMATSSETPGASAHPELDTLIDRARTAKIGPLPETLAVRHIERLRSGEGDCVAILCDDPDATDPDRQMAVECNGRWTGWLDRRFYGPNTFRALEKAAEERNKL